VEEDCVFCKIVNKEIPAHVVYEDEDFIAILDHRPLTKGNSLIIPKKHYRWVYDVPNFGNYFEVAKKVGLAAQKLYDAEWISFITLGWEVPHAHIRVIPRYKNDPHSTLVDINKFDHFSKEEMEKIAEEIKTNIDKT
jgi:histidine triad (HIT) family protein